MITPGEQYLAYIGLPDDYPRGNELANEVSGAILEAAEDVVAEWKRADPLLRAMLDERCTLWTWAPVAVGSLPLGILIEVACGADSYRGQVRAQHSYEHERYPNEPGVTWLGYDPAYARPKLDTVVQARVPVPFDLSALVEEVAT